MKLLLSRSAFDHSALAVVALLTAAIPHVPALAQDHADEFCRRVGRNQAIFEMPLLPGGASAAAGETSGAYTCVWVFERGNGEIYNVRLDSKPLASEAAARQAILLARLPENRRGKTVEPLPKLGDDGLSRATVENGAITLFELEAVKSRRHFLLTVRPLPGKDVNYRVSAASINFLGSGISGL